MSFIGFSDFILASGGVSNLSLIKLDRKKPNGAILEITDADPQSVLRYTFKVLTLEQWFWSFFENL